MKNPPRKGDAGVQNQQHAPRGIVSPTGLKLTPVEVKKWPKVDPSYHMSKGTKRQPKSEEDRKSKS